MAQCGGLPGAGAPTVLRVSAPQLRVKWICGAAGAGKSVAAWGLFEALAAAGQQVAYVDIDHLGMLYPAADDDPERHRFKTAALDALVPGYLATGARVLVVSGVVDIHTRPALRSNVDLTMCLLSPSPAALRERILARGWRERDAEEAVAVDQLLRGADVVDAVVDSTGLSVAVTVTRLRRIVTDEGRPPERLCSLPDSVADLDVVILTGPRAVGSSTIAFGLARRRWRANRRTGFVDLQELGFRSQGDRPATDSGLSIGQLAAMHRLMAAHDAELLLVSGHLSSRARAALRMTLRTASLTVVRLRADEATLRDHVRTRARGGGARLAGDDLVGAGHHRQELVVATAMTEQAALDATGRDDILLEVSGRTPEELMVEVENQRRW